MTAGLEEAPYLGSLVNCHTNKATTASQVYKIVQVFLEVINCSLFTAFLSKTRKCCRA